MKCFNTTGKCIPSIHYMVNIDRQVQAAAQLVRQGHYFCINRGRQYGKTTTLAVLAETLQDEFCVFNISFEGLDNTVFASASSVCIEFLKILRRFSRINGASEPMKALLHQVTSSIREELTATDFTEIIEKLCDVSDKPLVVLIDEVDQASNNEGFIKFLGVLRSMFLSRDKFPTFQSVILAGVYDVKNLTLKLRSEEEHQYNSPWNIAVPFEVNMSLPADGIAAMLDEYRADHHLTFDTHGIGQMIFDYTSGYPFLVSRLCQIIDGNQLTWDKAGLLQAVNQLLTQRNVLFDDIVKKIDEYPELRQTLMGVLYCGSRYTYSPYEKYLQLGVMFSFLKAEDGVVKISCRLIETMLYTLFISEEKQSKLYGLSPSSERLHGQLLLQ